MNFRPHIFIGSSTEGLSIVKKIESEIGDFADCRLWTNSFDFGESNFDNLISKIAFYDYAILVATGDDVIVSRKKKSKGARDNVLFEFGLFAGGLGKSKVFYIVEEDTKIPSDLLGMTLPFISKKVNESTNIEITTIVDKIKKHIINKEKTFELGFLPSTVLAYGYFNNFVEKTVERLLEDKADCKVFTMQNNQKFVISSLQFTVLIPDDLSNDMFKKVNAKRLKDGWQKLKVDPKYVRDYDFCIDISKAENGTLHVIDIPITLNALNSAIELYSAKKHIGKTEKESVLERKEIYNFSKTLEYLISKSSLTKDIVKIEIVNI